MKLGPMGRECRRVLRVRQFAVVNNEGKVAYPDTAPFEASALEWAEEQAMQTHVGSARDVLRQAGLRVVELTPELEAQYFSESEMD